MNSILCRFFIYNLIKPAIVYRLIDVALIGYFFDDPFLFQNLNLSQTSFVDDAMKQRAGLLSSMKNIYKKAHGSSSQFERLNLGFNF